MMGMDNNKNLLYLIDFGLAILFIDSKDGTHIKESNTGLFSGTAHYATLNAMRGVKQGRRDDMESIGYLLVYLLKGKLPW